MMYTNKETLFEEIKEIEIEKEKVFILAESVVSSKLGKPLNNLQRAILKGAWEDKTYENIALEANCSEGHIKDVAADLWKQLSEGLGERVGKKSFKAALERRKYARRISSMLQDKEMEKNVAKYRQDWGEIPDISEFYGRNQELATLQQWVIKDKCRLVMLLGMGGIGKTSLAAKFTKQLFSAEVLGKNTFELVIWRSLSNASSVENILVELLHFFTCHHLSDLPESLEAKILLLIECLRNYRCLVILDNVESILEAEEDTNEYQEENFGYHQLFQCFAMTNNQSCLILTSREKPKHLAYLEGESLPVRSLYLKDLELEDVKKIFAAMGVFEGSERDWQFLWKYYGGNPLMLKIVACHVRELFEFNLCKFFGLGEYKVSAFKDLRSLLDKQFNRLSDLEKVIMYQLAVEPLPIGLIELQNKICLRAPTYKFIEALVSLIEHSLIQKSNSTFILKPVMIDYVNIRKVFI